MICGKFRHPDAAGATRHLRQLKAVSRENKKVLNKLGVYRCLCGAWHVGHNQRKGKRYPKPQPEARA